jgi:hypothetical protein
VSLIFDGLVIHDIRQAFVKERWKLQNLHLVKYFGNSGKNKIFA